MPEVLLSGAVVIVQADAKVEQAVLFEIAATSVAGRWRRVQCGQLQCKPDDARPVTQG